MRTNQAQSAIHRHSHDPLRVCAHDLRNLFAVVASAKSLLEKPLDEHRKRVVMDGLARVAVEGKLVTDALLAGGEQQDCGSDARAELQSLATIFKTLERPGLRIELASDHHESWILMAPAELRAVVLELVTNATTAGARRIQVRAGRRGCRYWLIVADDGSGFAARAPEPARPAGLHGTGMRRLATAASSAHGKLRIRSKSECGSVIALILPIMRVLASDVSDEASVVRSIASGNGRKSHGQRSAL